MASQREVDSALFAKKTRLFEKALDIALKVTEATVEHTEGDIKSERLAQMKNRVRRLCVVDESFETALLNILTSSIEGQDVSESYLEDMLTMCNAEVDKAVSSVAADKKKKYKMLESYEKSIAELVQNDSAKGREGNAAADDDFAITQADVNIIDPFGKLPMVEPMKNKLCGHNYERTVVMELLTQRPQMRCPVVGCSVKTFGNADLEPNHELRRFIARSAKSQPEGSRPPLRI